MSIKDKTHIADNFGKGQASSEVANKPTVEIDFEKYFECTKHFDMSESEQRELIEALYKIMFAFVDIGFDLNPVQHVSSEHIACGQTEQEINQADQSLGNVIKSIVSKDESLNQTFARSSECNSTT